VISEASTPFHLCIQADSLVNKRNDVLGKRSFDGQFTPRIALIGTMA
jgi:hypothetical protein